METEITPEQLLNDMRYAQKLEDSRLIILFLHLHIEYFIRKLCKEKRILGRRPIKEQAKLLTETGVVEKPILGIIELVCDLRNELIHNLLPDLAQIERWIKDFNPADIKFDASPILTEEKIKEIVASTPPLSRLQLYTIPIIVQLYRRLKEVRNEEIDFDIQIYLETIRTFNFNFLKKTK